MIFCFPIRCFWRIVQIVGAAERCLVLIVVMDGKLVLHAADMEISDAVLVEEAVKKLVRNVME